MPARAFLSCRSHWSAFEGKDGLFKTVYANIPVEIELFFMIGCFFSCRHGREPVAGRDASSGCAGNPRTWLCPPVQE